MLSAQLAPWEDNSSFEGPEMQSLMFYIFVKLLNKLLPVTSGFIRHVARVTSL